MASYTKLASGKTRVMIRKSGHYQSKSFGNKALARAWANAVELKIDQQATGVVSTNHATLADLLRQYMAEVRIKSASTTKFYDRVCADQLGAVKLKDLNYSHVDDWIQRRLVKAKPASVRIYLSLLSKTMRWGIAVKRLSLPDGIFRDAMARMRFNGLNLSVDSRTRTATADELNRLNEYWERNSPAVPMSDIVTFAVESCCRIGEICKVEAGGYQREARTLWVLGRKNSRDTELPLSATAIEIVERRIANGFVDRLFPYTPELVRSNFKRACVACKIED